jgi:CRP-like cAMP-binding protein
MSSAEINHPLSAEQRECLLASPLLAGLDVVRQEEVIALGCIRKWKRGDFLFMDGAPVNCIYYLLNGKAREYYCNGSGAEFQRCLAHPGSHIGLHNTLNREARHTHTCAALTPIVAFAWQASSFIGYLRRHPEIGLAVATILSRSFESSCRRNCLCQKTGARSRIAGYLLSRLCVQCEQPCGCSREAHPLHIDLRPLTHAAEDINLARETFSRTLSVFHDEGILSCSRGMVIIHNVDALKNLSGDD